MAPLCKSVIKAKMTYKIYSYSHTPISSKKLILFKAILDDALTMETRVLLVLQILLMSFTYSTKTLSKQSVVHNDISKQGG